MITAVNGKAVKDARDLATQIGAMAPRPSVKLTVLHKGAEKTVTLTLGELPNAQRGARRRRRQRDQRHRRAASSA